MTFPAADSARMAVDCGSGLLHWPRFRKALCRSLREWRYGLEWR